MLNFFFARRVKSKRIAFFMMASILLCFGLPSSAQNPDKLYSFGIGLEGGVSPNVATTQMVDLGLTGRFSFHAGPGYVFMGTGYLLSRAGTDFQIPLRAGYKFTFAKGGFLMGELGYYFYRTSENNFPYQATTIRGLSIAPSVGVQFGVFEVGLRVDVIVNQAELSTIGFVLGWNFYG
jgi:hypothetical protein